MKTHWLNFSKLSVGIAEGSSSRLAELFYTLLRSRIAAGALGPIIAGAVIFLAAGMHLQAAPVVNADIARLLEAGMPEQVIVQTIAAGQPNFDLSPDALIALKNKGATPAVLSAMLATAHPTTAAAPTPPPSPTDAPAGAAEVPSVPTATPAPALSAPPDDPLQDPPSVEPGQVSFGYFQGQLAPYGNWVQLPEYGWCWQPTVVSQDPFWRPYCQAGHWAYTDQGWFWASDYPWGDVVFHYGRWARHPGFGWVWVPDYTWAPSWVAWRHGEGDGFIGWAPLPPSARFVAGVGLTWRGRVVVDADFGLGPADFFFVSYDHYWEHDFRSFLFRPERAEFFWRRSVMRNGYRFNNGRYVIAGIGPQRMEVLTRHPVRPFEVREFARQEQHEHFVARHNEVVRHVEIRRDTLHRDNIRREPDRAESAWQSQGHQQPAVKAKTLPAKPKPGQQPAPNSEDKKDQNAK
jgi:hypothetical protein